MKMSFGILFMIFCLQSCGSISTEYSVDYDHPRFTVVMGGFDELLEETCVKKLKDIQGSATPAMDISHARAARPYQY
jgi:hypothetical protein